MNLIRIEKVQEMTTFGKSTIWELAGDENSDFPKAEKLSARVTVWKENEIIEWIESKFLKNAQNSHKKESLKKKKQNTLDEES